MLNTLGGAIVFILNVWAIAMIIGSSETTGTKVLWVILVILLPIIGFLIWLFAGPRPAPKA